MKWALYLLQKSPIFCGKRAPYFVETALYLMKRARQQQGSFYKSCVAKGKSNNLLFLQKQSYAVWKELSLSWKEPYVSCKRALYLM